MQKYKIISEKNTFRGEKMQKNGMTNDSYDRWQFFELEKKRVLVIYIL